MRYSYFVREVGLVNDQTANFMKHLESTITEFIKAEDMLKAYAVSLTYLQYKSKTNKDIYVVTRLVEDVIDF